MITPNMYMPLLFRGNFLCHGNGFFEALTLEFTYFILVVLPILYALYLKSGYFNLHLAGYFTGEMVNPIINLAHLLHGKRSPTLHVIYLKNGSFNSQPYPTLPVFYIGSSLSDKCLKKSPKLHVPHLRSGSSKHFNHLRSDYSMDFTYLRSDYCMDFTYLRSDYSMGFTYLRSVYCIDFTYLRSGSSNPQPCPSAWNSYPLPFPTKKNTDQEKS